jgi:hypothetical protein
MNNRTNKAVEEFYSSLTIARLLNIKAEDVQNFCYQHKIKTKVHDNGNESKLFVSSKSLLDHLARSKVSDQTDIALKWQALKQSIDSKNNKRIDRKPKKKQELPTCSEMPEGFVIAKKAARILGLHTSSIRNYIKAGKLGTKKIKHRHGFKYVVSIRSCEDLMEARKNIFKKCEELIEKCGKGDISVDAAYQKIKTNKEDKMNQDNNFKLPSIDNYMLSHVIDLNTLALVYPNLRDWLAENENATIRKFIVDTIKQMDHLSKNCKHGE